MTRIAVLGANGQVGSEVCLGLANELAYEVVPVCRNRLGSAFLRHAGLPCRHGRIADPTEASALIGDCDIVANFALAGGSPREAHEQNRRIIESSISQSLTGATILLFSTATVYQAEASESHKHSAYAREKLACEELALALGKRYSRRVIVYRLGHVSGELQGISLMLRSAIVRGPVMVPFPERASNTTQVAAICDAILLSGQRGVQNGVYDLFCHPQWSWREVLNFEAERAGATLELAGMAPPVVAPSYLRKSAVRAAQIVASSPAMKERLMSILTKFSPTLNARAQAVHRRTRAAADIARLRAEAPITEAMMWNEVGTHSFPGATVTIELLRSARFSPRTDQRPSWPADLPFAAGHS